MTNLPAQEPKGAKELMDDLPPSRIVEKLDEYIIGQKDAKKAVAVAITVGADSGSRSTCGTKSRPRTSS